MKYFLLSAALIFCCFTSFSHVVINEIDADTPSTDTMEFIELKSTTSNFSLNGYVLVFFNGTTNGDANASYLGKGILQIQLVSEEKEFYESFVTACSISDTLKITPDVTKPDYIVSGNIKKLCVDKNLILDQTPPKFEVKEIKRGL